MLNKTGRKSAASNNAVKGAKKKERPQGSGSVGSHKPGGDGRGNKKVHEDHDAPKGRR